MVRATSFFLLGVIGAVLGVIGAAPGKAWAEDVSNLATRAKPSVVHLTILNSAGEPQGNGTGFFVSEGGLIVTNHHVVDPAFGIRVTLSDGRRRDALGMLANDAERDIAIIKVADEGFPVLPLWDGPAVQEGVEVVVLGSPLGLSWTVSEGIVSAIRQEGVPRELTGTADRPGPLIQITAPISPGSSGSPVFTMDGSVVGVAVMASVASGQNVNFAVPIGVVKDLLARIPDDATPEPFAAFPWINLAVSVAVIAGIGVALWLSRSSRRRGRKRRR